MIGGSRDLFQSVVDAYLKQSASTEEDLITPVLGNHKVTFLTISNTLDVQPLLSEKLSHQTSCRRYLLDKIPSNYQLVQFGIDGSQVSHLDLDYLNKTVKKQKNTARLIWLKEAKEEGIH